METYKLPKRNISGLWLKVFMPVKIMEDLREWIQEKGRGNDKMPFWERDGKTLGFLVHQQRFEFLDFESRPSPIFFVFFHDDLQRADIHPGCVKKWC